MAGTQPSPFNPGAQMAHFLHAMGLRQDEAVRAWRLTGTQVWSQEELERMWADAHPLQDELTMLAAVRRPERG